MFGSSRSAVLLLTLICARQQQGPSRAGWGRSCWLWSFGTGPASRSWRTATSSPSAATRSGRRSASRSRWSWPSESLCVDPHQPAIRQPPPHQPPHPPLYVCVFHHSTCCLHFGCLSLITPCQFILIHITKASLSIFWMIRIFLKCFLMLRSSRRLTQLNSVYLLF